ncbi:MAG: hypothetical protein ACRDKJ_05825 [Actinomycetota bacterium]
MATTRFGVIAALVLSVCVPGPLSAAAAKPKGAEVGFWAAQNLQPCAESVDPANCPRDTGAFTDEVWNVLAKRHGLLYLNLVFGSDFGPNATRSDGLALLKRANALGIAVNAWITVPLSQGTFANENNAAIMAESVRTFAAWAKRNRVRVGELVLDLEFPTGYQPAAEAVAGDPSGLTRSNIDPVHQCAAIATYRKTIKWAHDRGLRISGSPVPFALDDLLDGSLALQDALDITAFPPLGYDRLYLQAYRTYNNQGSGYVASYYREMQRFFGRAGQVTVGDTAMSTPPYTNLEALVADVRMLAGLGATTIPVFDLAGTVRSFGADGVATVIDAGRRPLTGAELRRASAEDDYTRIQRTFFQSLDAAATALTPVVSGRPPNAYPRGCATP